MQSEKVDHWSSRCKSANLQGACPTRSQPFRFERSPRSARNGARTSDISIPELRHPRSSVWAMVTMSTASSELSQASTKIDGDAVAPNDQKSSTRQTLHQVAESTTAQDILLFLIAFRILNALSVRTFFQPDEFFQSLEPAWQMVFGENNRAWITWVGARATNLAIQNTDGSIGMETSSSICNSSRHIRRCLLRRRYSLRGLATVTLGSRGVADSCA